ncbi:hypothetical protein [Actinomycetospora chibensis]|uniref:DUF2029 domain-containing protein n=1 Tax=Actinomycetospora chibensis TaxID=663606 RepID=A0ABV9RMN1_9PSEU|nr:hypothetical protein [Actinomycetospora chibensis]MDD7924580.1 hypothetical protein [Actinomycetospora chibensis]
MLQARVPVRRRVGHLARATAPSLLLALILAVVSWHTATNLGGIAGGVVYATGCVVVLVVVLPVATRAVSRGPAWVLPTLVAVVVAVLVALFVLGFPAAYGHAMGVGSDRSDALDVALARLADGRYPYEGVTYLGNPITPLPGALLMAAPFAWLTGDAAWQNVAGLLLLLPLLHRGSWRRAEPTLLWACAALGGLEVVREFVVGDDLVTGAVPAVAAAAWTLALARGTSIGALVAAGTALGIATCTRPHLALVVMVVAGAVGAVVGWRRAVLVGTTASAVWALLILPFLAGGSARFSPWHVAAKVTGDRGLTAGIVVVGLVAAALLVAALLLVRPSSPSAVGWFCAAVLVAPSVLSLARRLAGGPAAELDLTLGAAAVPFALWAVSARRPAPDTAPDPSAVRPLVATS